MPYAVEHNEKFAAYASPARLVSTAWLAAALESGAVADGRLVVVESDEDVLLYETGHIPGAVTGTNAAGESFQGLDRCRLGRLVGVRPVTGKRDLPEPWGRVKALEELIHRYRRGACGKLFDLYQGGPFCWCIVPSKNTGNVPALPRQAAVHGHPVTKATFPPLTAGRTCWSAMARLEVGFQLGRQVRRTLK
jgi:hypothetical protein